jgi:carbamoyl-phosphate synthase small subunit
MNVACDKNLGSDGGLSAVLVLEDGRVFPGRAYGVTGRSLGEVVFRAGMTGYQETLTAPRIGDTGWNDEDDESARIWVSGYVVRDPARAPSNRRATRSPGGWW